MGTGWCNLFFQEPSTIAVFSYYSCNSVAFLHPFHSLFCHFMFTYILYNITYTTFFIYKSNISLAIDRETSLIANIVAASEITFWLYTLWGRSSDGRITIRLLVAMCIPSAPKLMSGKMVFIFFEVESWISAALNILPNIWQLTLEKKDLFKWLNMTLQKKRADDIFR